MNLSEQFPTDKEKSRNGVPVKIGDATFHLTYFNSSVAQLIFQAELQKNRSTMDAKEAVFAAMIYTLVEVVILGWDNLEETSDEGVTAMVEYSKEEAARILEMYDGLGTTLMGEAMNIVNFKREKKAETLEK